MNNLIILPTHNSLFVSCNYQKGEVIISGNSLINTTPTFFKPVDEWLVNFAKLQDAPLTIHFDLEYYNTSGSLCILSVLRLMNSHCENKDIRAFWHYYSTDEDMFENGEDYKEIAKFPTTLIPHEYDSSFSIKKTDNSPLIYFDQAGDFVIEGNCTSDNPLQAYQSAIKWLNALILKPKTKSFSLDIHILSIDDLNLPYIQAILCLIDALHAKGCNAKIKWNYSNASIERIGEECLANLSLHYSFNPKHNED